MRLIGHFKDENQAFEFHAFLLREGIQNSYDAAPDVKETIYHVWITEEEDFSAAVEWFKRYQESPQDPRFQEGKSQVITPVRPIKIDTRKKQPKKGLTLTVWIILVCSVLFFINFLQRETLKNKGEVPYQLVFTPLEKEMLFDYPKYFEDLETFYEKVPIHRVEDIKDLSPENQARYRKIVDEPTWKGVSELITDKSFKGWKDLPGGILFGKIRQGEWWRLFTPCLMHDGLFHILFNMCWVWMLGKQIEERLGKLRMIVMVLIVGIIPNIAQYLMGGPTFVGFSGIIVAMVGFIWVRQKIAPWEGYPLQRSLILLTAIFVFAMLGLQVLSFILQYLHIIKLVLPIANTAHMVGGLVGILCARLPFFARGKP
jgi:GlpG protein